MAIISRPSIPEVVFERVKTDLTEFAFNFFQDGITLDVSARTYKVRLKTSGVNALDKASSTNAAGRVTFALTDAEKTNLNSSEYQFFLVEILAGGGEKTLMAGTLRWSVPFGKPTGLVSAPDVSVNYISATQELMVALGVVDFGSMSSAASAAEALASLEAVTDIQADVIERQTEIEENTQTALDSKNTAVLSADLARSERLLAQQLVTNAVLAQNPLGDWNPATNSPALTAVPPAAPGVPKGSYYRIGTTPALAPFSGKNFTSGVTNLPVGTLLIKDSETQWAIQLPSSTADADLNATKVADSGRTTGLLLPELQYRHSRGETEMFGNNIWGSPKGLIMYEVMTESVVFNRVRIPVYMVTPDQPATFRVYKASSYVKNPSQMTLLSEVTIPSGAFNSVNTSYQTVNMPSAVRLKAGEYCYIALWCDTASKMVFRRWDVNSGAAPFRHIFLYTSTADQWNIVWSESSIVAGFAQASFDLTLVNNPADLEAVKTKLSADLSGIKAVSDEGNALYGSYFPRYQFIHPRGASEVEGNANPSTLAPFGDTQAVGIYEELTKPATFDRITLPVFVTQNVPVTLKVLYSKNYTLNTWMMTELASISYAAGQFNGDKTKNQIVTLASRIHADPGFLYVMVHSDTAGRIGNKYWDTIGTAPTRKRFLRLTTSNPQLATPWNASWGETSSIYYSPSLILSESSIEENQTLGTRMTTLEGAMASTVTKAADGKLDGVYIPVIQYQHPRGTSELMGNTAFQAGTSYWGFGFVQQMTAKVTFNKVRFGLMALQENGTVTFRVYKGNALSQSPATMTLLGEVVMNSNQVNKNPNGLQTIYLPSPATVNSGDYIHVMIGSDILNNLRILHFNVDAASPARLRFKTRTSSDLWGSAWADSSGSFYAASFELSLVNEMSDARLSVLEYKNPRPTIPLKIYAVVGIELSLYYDAMIYGKDAGLASPEGYSVVVTCTKGVSKERYWRLTAVAGDVGTYPMYIQIYDTAGNLLTTKSVSLIIVAASNPAAQKYIVDEGDSTVADSNNRTAMNEDFSLMTGGLTPLFLGTAGGGTTKSEGWGGSTFLGHISQNMTITGGSRTNSFWNPSANGGAGALDIGYYKASVIAHTGTVDIVSIRLGINDCRGALKTEAQLQTILAQSKTLVDLWINSDPNTKVIVQLPLVDMNTQWGSDKVTYRANMWRLRELILSAYDNNAYNARVFVGQAGICVDRYYGYQIAIGNVSRRYGEQVITHTDSVHPRSAGYRECGDATFAQILALLQ